MTMSKIFEQAFLQRRHMMAKKQMKKSLTENISDQRNGNQKNNDI